MILSYWFVWNLNIILVSNYFLFLILKCNARSGCFINVGIFHWQDLSCLFYFIVVFPYSIFRRIDIVKWVILQSPHHFPQAVSVGTFHLQINLYRIWLARPGLCSCWLNSSNKHWSRLLRNLIYNLSDFLCVLKQITPGNVSSLWNKDELVGKKKKQHQPEIKEWVLQWRIKEYFVYLISVSWWS